MHRPLLWILFATICGCASEKHLDVSNGRIVGAVSGSIIPTKPQDQYSAKPGARFEAPASYSDNANPLYPEQLLAAKLPPIRVRVRIMVDEGGGVTSITPLDKVPPEQEAFLSSVQSALSDWKFWPLVQITDRPGASTVTSSDGETKQYSGLAQPLPFYQDYQFVFRQHNGKGTTSTQ
jgi:hypothetical protein